MTLDQIIPKLEVKLKKGLPGRAAQAKMAHVNRAVFPEEPADARIACVLLLLYPKNCLLYTSPSPRD